ncbi:MAG: NAD(P)-dependent oxidoreductase [Planctomycetota bacterium]|jgi:phosphoglycerate dehydrogenase-like enzyme
MVKIGVTELEYCKAREIFSAAAKEGFECLCVTKEEDQLAGTVRQAGIHHVVIGVDLYIGPLYDALPPGGVIARFGIAHDGVNKKLATEKKLFCTNTPGILDVSVAEHTIALILSAARQIPKLDSTTRTDEWMPIVGQELKGKTLVIIGCGAIGRQVAKIASFGLDMKVVGCEKTDVDMEQMRKDYGFTEMHKDFAETVVDADYISLHIPTTPENQHFINRERLSLLPRCAWLINTARGAVVDEVALFDTLYKGNLAGAALDVFDKEPYLPVKPDKDLRLLNNVIMTPHVGSSTQEACDRIAHRVLQNIKLAEDKRFQRMDLLNPEVCNLNR